MAYCPSCGTEMADNARFCSQCGSSMQTPAKPAQLAAAPSTEPSAPPASSAEPIWTGWPSRKRHVPMLAIGLVVLFGSLGTAAATGMPPILIASAIGLLLTLWTIGRMILEPMSLRYWLTADRLFIRRGILRRTTDQTEMIRVDDIRINQGFIDQLFGIGNIEIRSTDATDGHLMLVGIEKPMDVAEIIRASMQQLRRKRGMFIENI